MWLKLQARLTPKDVRLHQDVNKLVAALEFSADATLAAAKFASRAIATTVTSRRLLWRRHWQADLRSKWCLASSPFKGGKLFGEALDPILIENRDKKKVLPSVQHRADRRAQPYFRRQPFRGDSGSAGLQYSRSYYQGPDRTQDRSGFRDRSRQQQQPQQQQQQSQSRRRNRGAGYRPFRRCR